MLGDITCASPNGGVRHTSELCRKFLLRLNHQEKLLRTFLFLLTQMKDFQATDVHKRGEGGSMVYTCKYKMLKTITGTLEFFN